MAKATSSHPAFTGISRGDLVSIPHLKDGQVHRTNGRVYAFNDSGTQVLLEHGKGKPRTLLFAKDVMPAREIEAAAEKAARDAATPMAREKQVDYALSLIDRLGPIGWHNSDAGQMRHAPDAAELRQLKRHEISALIDSLRGELGLDDF
ncbi:hypothetical protein [Acrocarpospora sp. B8E8]|uniref:hypothetical protein n=1 Tax=Acrocarpospora sp. B8E8 TaxID=3153572 RepID=UPI00325D0A45